MCSKNSMKRIKWQLNLNIFQSTESVLSLGSGFNIQMRIDYLWCMTNYVLYEYMSVFGYLLVWAFYGLMKAYLGKRPLR